MTNKDLVRTWFNDIVAKGDLDKVDDIVHEDYQDGPNHTGPTGPEFVQMKFETAAKALTDVEVEIVDLIEENIT